MTELKEEFKKKFCIHNGMDSLPESAGRTIWNWIAINFQPKLGGQFEPLVRQKILDIIDRIIAQRKEWAKTQQVDWKNIYGGQIDILLQLKDEINEINNKNFSA